METYPNKNEKRKQIDMVSGLLANNSIQMPENPAGSVIDRPKALVEKGSIAMISL